MKQQIIICLLLTVFSTTSWAQDTVAKFKYEDAEKAYYDGNYQNCIDHLIEVEKILGTTPPNVLHLRILAQHKLLEARYPLSFNPIKSLQANCSDYLLNYDIAGLEEKYRDVYTIQQKLKDNYPLTENAFNSFISEKTAYKNKILEQLDNNMIAIKEASFMMGNKKGFSNTSPEHSVKLSSFSMSKYEITVEQYKLFIEDTNYESAIVYETTAGKKYTSEASEKMNWRYSPGGILHDENTYHYPVTYVSWYDAMSFCEWLTAQTGTYYRLPTEAEFEYVARHGGRDLRTLDKTYNELEYGWFEENSSSGVATVGGTNSSKIITQVMKIDDLKSQLNSLKNSSKDVRPVGTKKPNILGIYDIVGNVYEWCLDSYEATFYAKSPTVNPVNWTANPNYTVLRGGAHYFRLGSTDYVNKKNETVYTFRASSNPKHVNHQQGFRIVKPNPEEQTKFTLTD